MKQSTAALLLVLLPLLGEAIVIQRQQPARDANTSHIEEMVADAREAKDTADLEKMVVNLAKEGAFANMAPSVRKLVDWIVMTVNDEMKPKVITQHEEAQKLLDPLINAFTLCSDQKTQSDVDVGHSTTTRNTKSSDHKKCRTEEAALYDPKVQCGVALDALTSTKEQMCGHPLFTNPADPTACRVSGDEGRGTYVERNSVYFFEKAEEMRRVRWACDNATAEVDAKEPICLELSAKYDEKKPLCDAEQTALELAACSQAETTISTCETYTTCYQNALTSYNNAKPSIQEQEKDRKTEWYALMRIECMIKDFAKDKIPESGHCAGHDTSHLNLLYPEILGPQACQVGASEPCSGTYHSEEYLVLPEKAPTTLCTPCSWNTRTTTLLTTTTTTTTTLGEWGLPVLATKEAQGGDWTTISCDAGQKVIGGGCTSEGDPHLLRKSGPSGTNGWQCGGWSSKKMAKVSCVPAEFAPVYMEKKGGEWTSIECEDGYKIIGGGCDAYEEPYLMQRNGPEGDNAWTCGGHGGPKHVWAFCVPPNYAPKILNQMTGDTGDVTCEAGYKLVGGGCDATAAPYKFATSRPTSDSTYQCGGHGGPKKVTAICIKQHV